METSEESKKKLKYLFNQFAKGNNTLTRDQVQQFYKEKYENTDLQLNGTTLEEMVDSIFMNTNPETSQPMPESISFEQFEILLEESATEISAQERKMSIIPLAHEYNKVVKYCYRYGDDIFWSFIYVCINAIAFLLKFFAYSYDPVIGYCASFAKAFAQVILLNVLLAIVPMCRRIMCHLRQIEVLWRLIPFDKNIEFHKLCGSIILLSSVGHSICWCLILYYIRTEKDDNEFNQSAVAHLSLLRNFPLLTVLNQLPIWTGILMLIIACIAWPCTLEKCRRGNFNVFWFTHMLFFPFLFFMMIHGLAAWVNPPQAYLWVVPPCVIYLLERRYRMGKFLGRSKSQIEKVTVTENMVALFMTKPHHFEGFKPGMYLFLNIPELSRFEWHPFTISSAPQDTQLSVHIRRNGDWTNALHDLIANACKKEKCYPKIFLDGPVGAPAQAYNRYKVVMLIGAGIGVTPYVSILKSIMHMWEEHRCKTCKTVRYPSSFQIRKIYFYWITPDQGSLQWFANTMNQLSEMDNENRLEIHNYYSPMKRQSIVAPLEMFQMVRHIKDGHDIISGLNLKNLTHFGRPDWKLIARQVAKAHRNEKIGVFFCGPPKMEEAVSNVCAEYNLRKRHNVEFSYHAEKF